jgi:hypothetical protein
MEKLNTHYYDSMLKEQYKELTIIQDSTTDFLQIPWTKDLLFNEIEESLDKQPGSSRSKQSTINMLNLLKKDGDGHANYDPLNNIHTIDILTRTWYYIRKMSTVDQSHFFTQIQEINDGSCPQGRTTRLFQIYYSFF